MDLDCTTKYKCVGHKAIEFWTIDCDTEIATCTTAPPQFGDKKKQACYCLEQPNEDMPQMCDGRQHAFIKTYDL